MAKNKIKEEKLDKYISTKITTEEDLEQNIDLFAEAVQFSVQENLPKYHNTGKDQQEEVSSLVDG